MAYYAGQVVGTMEQDRHHARIYRGLRKHMYVGRDAPNHKSWVWPELKIVPFTTYTLDQMLEAIGQHEGDGLTVYDRSKL
jgi:hypothetical protein